MLPNVNESFKNANQNILPTLSRTGNNFNPQSNARRADKGG